MPQDKNNYFKHIFIILRNSQRFLLGGNDRTYSVQHQFTFAGFQGTQTETRKRLATPEADEKKPSLGSVAGVFVSSEGRDASLGPFAR
jgi:hypothetical protein